MLDREGKKRDMRKVVKDRSRRRFENKDERDPGRSRGVSNYQNPLCVVTSIPGFFLILSFQTTITEQKTVIQCI